MLLKCLLLRVSYIILTCFVSNKIFENKKNHSISKRTIRKTTIKRLVFKSILLNLEKKTIICYCLFHDICVVQFS